VRGISNRNSMQHHYCPGKICRLQPKFMISKALPRVEAGNDLNSNSPILSEIWGREVLGMFATMPHESWPNRLCPTIGSNSHLSDLIIGAK
jgi:hypothetical protein